MRASVARVDVAVRASAASARRRTLKHFALLDFHRGLRRSGERRRPAGASVTSSVARVGIAVIGASAAFGTAVYGPAFCTSRLSSRATATALERRRPDSAGPGRRRVRRAVLAIVRASLLRENWLLLAAFCWLRVFCVFSPRRSARSTTGLESSGYRQPTSSHVCQTSLPPMRTWGWVLPTVD